ncbi:MAG: hypothetical protein ACYDHB_13725 [Candidatus Dormibacteria bacterium]
MAANPLDAIRHHETAALVVVGALAGALFIWYLLNRSSSSASVGTAGTTTQTLTPASTVTGSGSGQGAANNALLQQILSNQVSSSGLSSQVTPSSGGVSPWASQPASQISPALSGVPGLGGLTVAQWMAAHPGAGAPSIFTSPAPGTPSYPATPQGLAPTTSPATVVPAPASVTSSTSSALSALNANFLNWKKGYVGGTSQQFSQDLTAASGGTPLTPAEALNLNYEHWLVSHPGGTSVQFSSALRGAAAKAA